MITQETLAQWTEDHGNALGGVYDCAARCLEANSGSTAAAAGLNRLRDACASLKAITKKCDRVIQARYVEAAGGGDASPEDAREAVRHLNALKEQTETTVGHLERDCIFWSRGTWAMPARREVIANYHQRRNTP